MVVVFGNNNVTTLSDDQDVTAIDFFFLFLTTVAKFFTLPVWFFGLYTVVLALAAGESFSVSRFAFQCALSWIRPSSVQLPYSAFRVQCSFSGLYHLAGPRVRHVSPSRLRFFARRFKRAMKRHRVADRTDPTSEENKADLPETQSSVTELISDPTVVGVLAYFYSMSKELRRAKFEPDSVIAATITVGALLYKDSRFSGYDFAGIIDRIVGVLRREDASLPETQSGFTLLKERYFQQVLSLVVLVFGVLFSGESTIFDIEKWSFSQFAQDVNISVPDTPYKAAQLLSDVLSTLSARFDLFVETRSLKAFFMNDFKNRSLVAKINAVLAKEETIKCTNFELAGYASSYHCLADLDDLIGQCKSASYEAKSNTTITLGKLRLEALRLHILARCQGNRLREAPFAVLIYGKSGLGKTILSEIVMKDLLETKHLPCDSRFVGRLNLEEEFQSTYEPHFTGVMLDDLANTKAEKSNVVLSQKIIEIINNAPVCTNQADLARKGLIWYKPAVVVGTTNVKDLQASVYSNQPDSILRRFVHVHLDEVDFAEDPADFLSNNWKGAVHVYEDRNEKGDYISTEHAAFTTTRDLVFILRKLCVTHSLDQASVVSGDEKFMDLIKPCEHGRSTFCVECGEEGGRAKTQSGSTSRWFSTGIFALFLFNALHDVVLNRREYHAWGVYRWVLAYKAWIGSSLWLLYAFFPGYYYVWMCLSLVPTNLMLQSIVAWLAQNASAVLRQRVRCGPRILPTSPLFTRGGAAGALTGVLFASSLLALFRTFGSTTPSSFSQGAAASHEWNDPKSVWSKDGVPTSYPLSRASMSVTPKDLRDIVMSNTARLVVKDGGVVLTNHTFHISGGFWVTNKHFVDKFPLGTKIDFQNPSSGRMGVNLVVELRESTFLPIGKTDLVLFKPLVPPRKDIKKFLPENCERFRNVVPMLATIVDPEHHGCPQAALDVHNLRLIDRLTMTDSRLGQLEVHTVLTGVCAASVEESMNDRCHGAATRPGDCGLPYLASRGRVGDNGAMIAGFHTAASGRTVHASVLTIKQFEISSAKYLAAHPGTYSQSGMGDMLVRPLDGPATPMQFVEPHYMGLAHQSQDCNLQYYGKLVGAPLSKPKSKVTDSFICSAYTSVTGIQQEYGAPGGGAPMDRPEHYERHFNGVSHISNGFPIEVLDQAARDYLDKISHSDPIKAQWKRAHILTLEEAINGVPGMAHADRLDMTTSPGYPHGGKKINFFEPYVNSKGEEMMLPTPGLARAVDELEEAYATGETQSPLFVCNLKDEPTKLSKKKVRVFSGAPLAFSILLRKYFLGLASLMSVEQTRLEFECAVGTNHCGPDWLKTYNYVTRGGELRNNMVAGDYQAFDQNMHASITERALGIILSILKCRTEYRNDRTLTIVRGLLTDLMFPTYLSRGEVFSAMGSNASGNNLTVLINCIVNSLYVRCVFFIARPLECKLGFGELVKLVTYGDDNLMGVDDRATKWFNHGVMVSVLGDHGIIYTMANKSTISIPLICIADADFLKRQFITKCVVVIMQDSDTGLQSKHEVQLCLSPLAFASINKMLMCYKGGELSARDVLHSTVPTALRESMHHGRERYDEVKRNLTSTLNMCAVSPDLFSSLISYDEQFSNYVGSYWVQHLPGIFVGLEP